MTRKFDAWAKANGATFYPVHPKYETVLGHKVYPSIFDIPGDIDLAIILTGKAVDTFEEVLARKAKFAVIFAAGFSETGKEGEKLEARLTKLVASGDVRLLGPNTNLNAFENFRDDLDGPVDRARHPVRPPGPARCSRARSSASGSPTGRRPATRSTSSSPTSAATSPTRTRSASSPATSRASRTAARSCSRPTTRRSCRSRS